MARDFFNICRISCIFSSFSGPIGFVLAAAGSAVGGVGRIVGAVFFLALGFAALTSCVSVMETLVANCMEIFRKSRREMCAAVGVYSLVTAILVGWVVGPKWIIAEVEKNGEHFGRASLYRVMMKYVVPVVMLILFLTSTGLGSLIFG